MESKKLTKSQQAISALIDISNISQRQLAINANKSATQIQDWKTNRRKPSLENFIELCEGSGIKASDVLKEIEKS